MRLTFPPRHIVSSSLATLSIFTSLSLHAGELRAQSVPASGQAVRSGGQERIPIRGVVVDARSGAPIDMATVELEGASRSTATRDDGTFAFNRLKPGGYMLVVHQLGYAEQRQYVSVSDTTVLRVALQPRPVELEALRVTFSRLESRRRAAPVSVRVLDRRDLTAAPYSDALQLVQARLMSGNSSCNNGLIGYGVSPVGGCLPLIRGTPARVSVWIDERPALGGMEELSVYDPSELQMVESYDGGRMIRVYTVWYMETLANRNVRPEPIYIF